MDDPIVERLNRLQAMLAALCEEAAKLKHQLAARLEQDRREGLPSEESRRPMTSIRHTRP
jgi:hypothetical protein